MDLGRRDAVGVAVVAAVVAAGLLTSPTDVLGWLAGLDRRPALLVPALVGVWLVRPFLGWPPTAVSAVVGFVLGPVVGFPVALAGVVGSAVPPYVAADRFEDGGLLGAIGERGRTYFRTAGDGRGVLAARLTPIPSDAVSCAAGLASVRPAAFVAGTAVGETPWTLAAVVVGSSARRLSTAGLGAVGLPFLVATTVAALLLLAGPAYRAVGAERAG